MTDSVAQGVKDNRRLASFTEKDMEEFQKTLQNLYDSEIEQWYKICPRDSWKFPWIQEAMIHVRMHKKIIQLERYARILEVEAELW